MQGRIWGTTWAVGLVIGWLVGCLAGCQSLSEGEEMVGEGGDYWRDTKEVIGSNREILDET